MPYSMLECKEDSDVPRVARHCDYWSVGIIMLEIVVGHKLVENVMRVDDI